MNTKLTLSLDSSVIDRAKKNLQTKDKSLSGFIEDYFRLLITTKTKRSLSSPIVEELTGIARPDKSIDERDLITEYLLEKYK
jgi:hypothetical protein